MYIECAFDIVGNATKVDRDLIVAAVAARKENPEANVAIMSVRDDIRRAALNALPDPEADDEVTIKASLKISVVRRHLSDEEKGKVVAAERAEMKARGPMSVVSER